MGFKHPPTHTNMRGLNCHVQYTTSSEFVKQCMHCTPRTHTITNRNLMMVYSCIAYCVHFDASKFYLKPSDRVRDWCRRIRWALLASMCNVQCTFAQSHNRAQHQTIPLILMALVKHHNHLLSFPSYPLIKPQIKYISITLCAGHDRWI